MKIIVWNITNNNFEIITYLIGHSNAINSIDTYENTSAEYRKEIEEKIFNVYRGTNSKSIYNFDELRRLNTSVSGEVGDSQVKNSVFDLESLDHMKKIKGKFFKS
jgi:WD40 repeat protein